MTRSRFRSPRSSPMISWARATSTPMSRTWRSGCGCNSATAFSRDGDWSRLKTSATRAGPRSRSRTRLSMRWGGSWCRRRMATLFGIMAERVRSARSSAGPLDRRIGVVILTNETNVGFPDALGLWLFDAILGNPRVDYVAIKVKELTDGYRKDLARFDRPAQAAPVVRAGARWWALWVNPAIGKAVVNQEGDALVMEIATGGAKMRLDPWDGSDPAHRQSGADRLLSPAIAANEGPSPSGFVAIPDRGPDGKLSTFGGCRTPTDRNSISTASDGSRARRRMSCRAKSRSDIRCPRSRSSPSGASCARRCSPTPPRHWCFPRAGATIPRARRPRTNNRNR